MMTNHSFYKSVTDKSPVVVTLKEVFDQIATGNYHKQIEKLRSTPDAEKRDRLKRALPAFTPSGVFNGGRKLSNLEYYPGIISLDFDKVDNVQLALAKSKLKESKHILGFFVSPSGNGLKVFVQTDANATNHTYAFATIKKYVERLIGIEADASCKDITRLCFLSYDPNAFFNEKATSSILFNEEIISSWMSAQKEHPNKEGSRNSLVFKYAVSCNAKGVQKQACFEYAKSQSTLENSEIYRAVDNAYSGNYKDERRGTPTYGRGKYGQLEEFLNTNYQIRFNVITNKPEVQVGVNYEPITDVIFNDMLRNAEKNHVPASETSLKIVLNSGFANMYNPYKDYFNHLPSWDGYDYFQDIVSQVPFSHPERAHKYLTRWLTGLVACLLDSDSVNQHMLVLVGAQGIGKTTFFNTILPRSLKSYIYHGIVRPDDKDTIALLADKALIVVDELDTMRQNQLHQMKEVLTKPQVTLRRPYGRTAENFPRRASFAASVNNTDFLVDPTGNRRYLCLHVVGVIPHKLRIDLNQLFSQAYELFRDGEPFWFNQEEILEIEEANQDFVQANFEEELLLKFFRPPHQDEEPLKLSASGVIVEILDGLDQPIGRLRPEIIGKMLTKHKFPVTMVKGAKKYKVMRVG